MTTTRSLAALTAAFALATPALAATIYEDSFEAPPAGDDIAGMEPTGYIVTDGETGDAMDIVVGTGTARTGSQQLNADHIGANVSNQSASATRSFVLTPATDQNIQVTLWARQTSTGFEDGDVFEISLGFGANASTYVFQDFGSLEGGTFSYASGGSIESPDAPAGSQGGSTTYRQYVLDLPTVDSDGQSLLNFTLRFNSNVASEDYFVDDILITGTGDIPEPASLALLGLGGLMLLPRPKR